MLNSKTWQDMAQLSELIMLDPSFTPRIPDGLTLHSSPWLQTGLRQDELRRWLWRQDVVAKYLLGWRWWSWRCTYCGEEHWSTFLVLRPNWCRVVVVLEAGRELNSDKHWKEKVRSAKMVETLCVAPFYTKIKPHRTYTEKVMNSVLLYYHLYYFRLRHVIGVKQSITFFIPKN